MARRRTPRSSPERAPLWYKDAVIYEARVRAFYDSDGDGIGDFRGLAEKLDYLQDLGVTALWLLPFYPSPLKDDGYDISDYESIHPDCGSMEDFRYFLREAHHRELKVITELVINHTSDQHPWFQQARRAPPGSRLRDYYVWSDTPERYREARIIFQDFEPSNWTWDPVAKAYFWHRFYAHQPDLNFEHPDVRRAVFRTLDYWFRMGVDGLRLDAIPYLHERDGTNCENLPETHEFLKALRRHVDERWDNRMLLAEANQWPEDAVAYFGDGDECHAAFHFPVMPRLFMGVQMEDRYPIMDILAQTPPIPESCQWALFLRNHDELTLEMVTDEERDYMYRVYAHDNRARVNLGIRRRLAPLLRNDRRQIELMNGLLFSLPGTPVLYYGDEIGMGDNFYLGDRNGVRTPMQWSADRNAGFSRANPQQLYLPVIIDPEYHYESLNVENQQNSLNSLLLWMKRLIGLRRRYGAFGRGSITFLTPSNRKVLAFIREHEGERILVVANLSRSVEYAELDLSAFRGSVPVEVFGGNRFPQVGDLPYLLTLTPHAFYWFELAGAKEGAHVAAGAGFTRPELQLRGSWDAAFRGDAAEVVEANLPGWLRRHRWFAGHARELRSVRITDAVAMPMDATSAQLLLLEATYAAGAAETYVVPTVFATGARADEIRKYHEAAIVAEVDVTGRAGREQGVIYDALEEGSFGRALLDGVSRRRVWKGRAGELSAFPGSRFRELRGPESSLEPRLLRQEQSNSSVAYGERLMLKLFRRPVDGINPELEMSGYLTEERGFGQIAPVAGHLEYRRPRDAALTLGVLLGFVPNTGDAWQFTVDELQRYFERVLVRTVHEAKVPRPSLGLFSLASTEPTELARETIGGYLNDATRLGRLTAEMHLALATETEDEAFEPEPFTSLYQRSLYQSMRNLTSRVMATLDERIGTIPDEHAKAARRLLGQKERLLQTFRELTTRKLEARRIRIHGDYHLGQVLYTGRDFVVIDFEGEPDRPVGERRLKRSPLHDVAGMLRSFDYAVHSLVMGPGGRGMLRVEDLKTLEPWAGYWYSWVSASFLGEYLRAAGDNPMLPAARAGLEMLLRVTMLEKAVYELGYELNHRPDWVGIPLRGIARLLQGRF